MLTPVFKLDQDSEFVLLTIKAPYVKSNDVEIYIDKTEFKFYVKPYFLRLYFPCELVEDGREYAKYDIENGTFIIKVPKKNQGEEFPNLDMLTTLLAPKKGFIKNPLIEVLNSTDNNYVSINSDTSDIEDEDGLCWEVEQKVYEPNNSETLCSYKYGFANQLSGIFERLNDDILEVIDLLNPDSTSPHERRVLRTEAENNKFDKDHYLADYFDENLMKDMIYYKAPWDVEYEHLMQIYKESTYPETLGLLNLKGNLQNLHKDTKLTFTQYANNQLLHLPNKEFLLSKNEENSLYLGLVDILFAYAYNHRTTEGENTSESAWTVTKLSSTLCWFDAFTNVHDVVIGSARRILCYPLYRSWKLFQIILRDVQRIFLLGKRWILKSLLDLQDILQSDENKYMLNDLYINNFCIWIQKNSDTKILSLANKLHSLEISKSDTGFNLSEIESTAGFLYLDSGSEIDSDSDSDSSDSSTSSDNDNTSSVDSDDYCSEEEEKNQPTEGDKNTDVNHVMRCADIASGVNQEDLDVTLIRTGMEELLSINKFVENTKGEQ